jgi:hypothetical protein
MKKFLILLIAAVILLVIALASCEKEPTYDKFIGKWVPDQDTYYPKNPNIIYYGFFKDSVRALRRISHSDTLYITISDAPPVATGAKMKGDVLCYNNFWTKNHPITPNCSTDSIIFYDVSSKILGDTMVETGSYTVYVNGVEQDRGVNYYIAKFVKKK